MVILINGVSKDCGFPVIKSNSHSFACIFSSSLFVIVGFPETIVNRFLEKESIGWTLPSSMIGKEENILKSYSEVSFFKKEENKTVKTTITDIKGKLLFINFLSF